MDAEYVERTAVDLDIPTRTGYARSSILAIRRYSASGRRVKEHLVRH